MIDFFAAAGIFRGQFYLSLVRATSNFNSKKLFKVFDRIIFGYKRKTITQGTSMKMGRGCIVLGDLAASRPLFFCSCSQDSHQFANGHIVLWSSEIEKYNSFCTLHDPGLNVFPLELQSDATTAQLVPKTPCI